jgi:hypothetical protein
LGQQKSPGFGYASLGLSLEQYGIKAVLAAVPGAVAVTAAEQKGFACGDLTPTEVAAGQTTATCGVVQATAPPPGANGGHATGSSTTSSSTAAAKNSAAAVLSTGGSGGGGGTGAGVDPSVSLSSGTGLAFTGGNPIPLVVVGGSLFFGAMITRRRLLQGRRTKASK